MNILLILVPVLGAVTAVTVILLMRGKKTIRELREDAGRLKAEAQRWRDLSASLEERLARWSGEASLLGEHLRTIIDKFNGLLEGAAAVGSMTDSQKEILQETSETIQDIAGTMSRVVDGMNAHVCSFEDSTDAVRKIASGSKEIHDHTEESRRVAESLRAAVAEGARSIEETAAAIRSIEESSTTVADSLKEIASIAARTNMLAMNAAIEAAHAGDSGKGFAVVASEVRGLAENSSRSVKSIASVINAMAERVRLGVDLSDKTGKLFREISAGIETTTALAGTIADKVVEQNEAAGAVLPEIESLVKQICAIQELSDSQKERSAEVKRAMESIAASSERIRLAEKKLVEEDYEILDLLEKSRGLGESLVAASQEDGKQHDGNEIEEQAEEER